MMTREPQLIVVQNWCVSELHHNWSLLHPPPPPPTRLFSVIKATRVSFFYVVHIFTGAVIVWMNKYFPPVWFVPRSPSRPMIFFFLSKVIRLVLCTTFVPLHPLVSKRERCTVSLSLSPCPTCFSIIINSNNWPRTIRTNTHRKGKQIFLPYKFVSTFGRG